MLRPARAGRGGLRVGRRARCRQKLGLGLSPLEDRWSNCLFFMIAAGYQPPLANVATQPPRDASSVATAPERRSWMSASPVTSVRRQPPRTVRERPRPFARMATGRQVQLTKQVGEYLVAAELSRRGLLTATFAGNVPDYDIVATGGRGRRRSSKSRRSPGPHGSSTSGHLRTCAARPERRRWGNRRPRQPATSSACSFDSTRTERTASTCSAGRNSSACSSTATGVYETATARGATVVIPPARTANVSGHGPRSPARDRTITLVKQLGRRRWKKTSGYHRQSRVENTFFRYKSIIGDGLRARSPAGQGSEVVLGCEILNRMTELGRPVSYRIGR